jgi:hypothetical protein
VPTLFSRKRFYFGAGALALVVLAVAAGWYWWSHRPYTEAQIIALIRQDIIPSVVQVRCASEDGGAESQGGTGLYYTDPNDHTPWVETNAHVVLGDDGLYHGCNVYFPNPSDGSFYNSTYPASQPLLYNNLEAQMGDSTVAGLDYALLPLVQDASSTYPFPPRQASIYDGIGKLCNRSRFAGKDINIGDKLYLIGYPTTGEDSVTLTEGIVSGFTGDFDQWIKTSAPVNHGNSGGIAIGESTGCAFGIPSEGTQEQGGNLSYVLSSSYISMFLNSLTGSTTYAAPDLSGAHADPSLHLTQTYNDPALGFTIDVPEGWGASMAGEPTSDGARVTSISSPLEGALDDFAEGMSIYQYATSTPSDLAYAVSQVHALAEGLDAQTIERTITLDGVTTYQTIFVDSSMQSYSKPMEGYFIIFRYKGQMYELVSQAEEGPHQQDYMLLMAGMGDSIHFKQ